MNRLPGTTLMALALPLFSAEARILGSSLPRTWPWSGSDERFSTTVVHPAPQAIMRRDHAVAERQARAVWQREKAAFESQHRENLRTYVATRLAIAEENARWNFIRGDQSARTAADPRSGPAAPTPLAAVAMSAAGAWVTDPSRPDNVSQPLLDSAKGWVEQAKHIAREVPKRTQQVLAGNDELVEINISRGVPKSLSVFMALLMLHVPSVALASLVAGVFLVRGRRRHSGVFCFALAAVLGAVFFFVLPW